MNEKEHLDEEQNENKLETSDDADEISAPGPAYSSLHFQGAQFSQKLHTAIEAFGNRQSGRGAGASFVGNRANEVRGALKPVLGVLLDEAQNRVRQPPGDCGVE